MTPSRLPPLDASRLHALAADGAWLSRALRQQTAPLCALAEYPLDDVGEEHRPHRVALDGASERAGLAVDGACVVAFGHGDNVGAGSAGGE